LIDYITLQIFNVIALFKLTEESQDEASCNLEGPGVADIEDISSATNSCGSRPPIVNVGKRKNPAAASDEDYSQSWRTALGPPPPMGHSRVSFVHLFSQSIVLHLG